MFVFVVFFEGGSFPRPVRPLPLLRFVTASGIIPAVLGPFRVLFRNGCRFGCPEGNACNGITCVNPALRSPSAECSGRSAGCFGIGIFRELFQRGCLWDPFVFFGRSFASERSIRVSVPGARSVGCMRRTPECPSILPVSSRSPDRTDPKTHARRKSRTKMQ